MRGDEIVQLDQLDNSRHNQATALISFTFVYWTQFDETYSLLIMYKKVNTTQLLKDN